MEVGVRGENGAPALNRVALDHSTAPGRAPGLFHRTEVNSVLGRTKRRGTATLIIVLVRKRPCMMRWRICLYFLSLPDKITSCKFCSSVNKSKCGKMPANKSASFIWITAFAFQNDQVGTKKFTSSRQTSVADIAVTLCPLHWSQTPTFLLSPAQCDNSNSNYTTRLWQFFHVLHFDTLRRRRINEQTITAYFWGSRAEAATI